MQRGVGRPGGDQNLGQRPKLVRRPRVAQAGLRSRTAASVDATLLSLRDDERTRLMRAGALMLDVDGQECLRGLTRAESVDYIELDRRGLDNDDAAFLRYIQLGDRHAAATGTGD